VVAVGRGQRRIPAHRRIRAQVGTSAIPGAIGEDVVLGNSNRAAAVHIPQGIVLERLVMVLAPFKVVDRADRRRWTAVDRVVAVLAPAQKEEPPGGGGV